MLDKIANFFWNITLRLEYRSLKSELNEIYETRKYAYQRELDIIERINMLDKKEIP